MGWLVGGVLDEGEDENGWLELVGGGEEKGLNSWSFEQGGEIVNAHVSTGPAGSEGRGRRCVLVVCLGGGK